MYLKEYSAKTHQGPYLHINEDGFEFDIANEFAVVVDAFGGSNVGPQVARKILDGIHQAYKYIVSDREATMPFFYAPEYLIETNAMINACLKVHHEIIKENSQKKIEERGGASIIIAAKVEDILSFITIGNCKAYLIRDQKLKLVAHDNTFEMVTNDHHPLHLRTTPMRAIGFYERLEWSTAELRLQEEDQVLLMTDGLYAHLSEVDIVEIIRSKSLKPNEKMENLFDMANNRGNQDNQAGVLLSY